MTTRASMRRNGEPTRASGLGGVTRDRPLVTIGIPTYNRADKTLRRALESALAQDYPHLQVIVADNCSEDDTERVVREVGRDRVDYLRHPTNIGAEPNFNSLVARADGEFFLLLHDDDQIDPDFVTSCVAATGTARPGLIRTGTRVIGMDGQIVYSRRNQATGASVTDLIHAWFTTKTSFYLCSTVFHTETLQAVGGFSSQKHLFNDVATYVRVAAAAGSIEVPDVKATFLQHVGSLGKVGAVQAWAEDAKYVIDVMCDAVSRADAGQPTRPDGPWGSEPLSGEGLAAFRRDATAYFCRNCYHRAGRIEDPAERAMAFQAVHETLHCRQRPWQYRARRWARSVIRKAGSSGS
ncbi:MAG: glycosyltransferase family A protein [Trueperaceae bacterium]